jgi:hypothetical protein
MAPWLSEPGTRWIKATIDSSSPDFDPERPNRVVGHAGWITPERTEQEILNFWRVDASQKLGWATKMGWSREYEDELWSGTDTKKYMEVMLMPLESIREDYMKGIGHW